MDSSLVSLVLVIMVWTAQAEVHEVTMFYGCSSSADCQVQLHLDGDQIFYTDFQKQRIVWTAPLLPEQKVFQEFYTVAVVSKDRLHKHYLPRAEQLETGPPTEKAPTVFIYPMEEAEEGQENTWFCYISHFYPPSSINVTWTRNGVEVVQGRTLSNLIPERDGTFSQLAGLSVRPRPDEVLQCSVKHRALSRPAVRTWVVPGRFFRGSSAPWVCLALGLVCLVLGIVVFIVSAHASLRLKLSHCWRTSYHRVVGQSLQT